MLDSLGKLKAFVSADGQQISDKSYVKWTGIGTSSKDAAHIHKQYRCILNGRYGHQHWLPWNAGIYLSEYGTGCNIPQNTCIAPNIISGDHRHAGQYDSNIFCDASL